MSQDDLELAVRGISAATERPEPDFETVKALFHPDHMFVPVESGKLGEAEAQGARGYKAWRAGVQDLLALEVDVVSAVDVGPGKVLVVMTARFHGAASGIEMGECVWAVVTVAIGQIRRTEAYFDEGEARDAAGLRD